MRCEVVAVGTELLLGQIVDTNSSWIGENLALTGIDSHFQTKVGDNLDRMISCIRLGLERGDAVITCGGLGPTQDDITREAIAEVMGVSLARQADMGEKIRALFERRGRVMAENNLRQADLPEGASFIPEMPGTAPGLICPIGDKVVYAVPGVPHEMRTMMQGSILPDLQKRAGVNAVIKSRVIKTWGKTESGLAEMLADRIDELDASGTATIAFQASGIEGLKIRITAKAQDDASVEAVLADEEARIRPILGDCVFGMDDQTMESVVLDMLRDRGLSLAVAEEVTGGLISTRLTAIPGFDGVLRGSLVSSVDAVQRSIFGLTDTLSATPEGAATLAEGARTALGADIGIATLAADEPEDQEKKRRGTVYLGLALNGRAESHEVHLPGDRNRVRQYAVISLLNYLRRSLLSLSPEAL